MCEHYPQVMCIVCGWMRTDRAHIRSVAAGGTLDDFNIVRLCREHHQEQHKLGWPEFYTRYDSVRDVLNKKGWSTQTILGQRRLVRDIPENESEI